MIPPRRVTGVLFGVTAYATDDVPCPSFALAIDIHETSGAADHVQSRSAVTATVPDPPEAGNVAAEPAAT